MTVTIEKEEMSRGLGVVSRAVSTNPIIPLLGNILVEAGNKSTCLTATNMEIGITYAIPSKGKKGFRTCIPAKTFNDLVGAVYTEELVLELEDSTQSLKVTTDTSRNKLKCMVSDEFPEIPKVTKPNIVLPSKLFKEMVNRVAFAARVNDVQSNLSGVLLVIEKEGKEAKFVMFATDGLRMSYEEITEGVSVKGKATQVIVRANILETISRTLPSEGELQIEIGEKNVLFHCNNVDVLAQQLGGDFPNYKLLKGAIPKAKTTLTVNTIELFRACKQIKVFSSDSGASLMDVSGMIVNYSALSKNKGDSTVSIAAMKKGNDVTIAMSVYFLFDVLEVCKEEQVVIEMSEPKQPIIIKMKGYKPYFHLVMPINLEEAKKL